jgi:DNA helicase-2/ATP-dependent DNA helicase PcrA
MKIDDPLYEVPFDPTKYLTDLNTEQRLAVETTEGPILILAGAGAGKTKVITHRILHLIKKGVVPTAILAITFTNKSAKEMRERVVKLIDADRQLQNPISQFERPFVSTFHALGVHIIKENAKLLGIPRHFNIFDRSDSLSAIKLALKEIGLDPKQFEPGRMLSLISKQKGGGITLDSYRENIGNDFIGRNLLLIWEKYEKSLRAEGALDFDDLLLKTSELLRTNVEVRTYYQKQWEYVHIDEYQDTNKVQYDIAKALAFNHHNIAVVGDIDQSIYSWRGADFKNIMRFENDYPEAKTVLLEENYRSTKTILEAANTIIAKNVMRKDKNLFTKNPDGEKITVYGGYDEEDEAHFITKTMRDLMKNKVAPKQVAVLYRANFQSRILEEAFLQEGVAYQVLGVRFFERKEVKDVLSYLRASLNPDGLADLKRIINTPPRGIGKTTVLKIFAGEEASLPPTTKRKIEDFRNILSQIREGVPILKPSETIASIITLSGMKDDLEKGISMKQEDDRERLENIYELVALAEKYDWLQPEEGIEKLLTDAALASDQDELKEEANAVKLMTVHASKGLEFDYVFITGLEEGLFPHSGMDKDGANQERSEEERRLFYVALTRARHKLFLSYAAVRTIFGMKKINVPSEFLSDIGDELIEGATRDRIKTIYLDD